MADLDREDLDDELVDELGRAALLVKAVLELGIEVFEEGPALDSVELETDTELEEVIGLVDDDLEAVRVVEDEVSDELEADCERVEEYSLVADVLESA